MLKTKSVPVTAYATLTPCGLGKNSLFLALKNNQSALNQLTVLDLPFSTPVGEIKIRLPDISSELAEYHSRNARVGLAALNSVDDGLRIAVEKARAGYGADRVGVVIGTSTSGLFETEVAYCALLEHGKMPDDFHFLTRHAYQATPRYLQQELQLQGPCFAISTACSSGAKAIAAGQRLINSGVCDAVLVGGIDTLCGLTLRGFKSLELVSSDFCRPMDIARKGINIGEAAGLLLLEKPTKGNQNFPQVLSVGESSDAYHMSSPHPEGKGAVEAMSKALNLAGLTAQNVDYINLHATATPVNDRIEAKAVYQVFDDTVPCSGSKGITGHTLGAAGALEAIIALLALEHQFIPGTCGLEKIDEDFMCKIVKESLLDYQMQTVMSNSFGFGGNNASVILSKCYE